jgi:hypothetical protein
MTTPAASNWAKGNSISGCEWHVDMGVDSSEVRVRFIPDRAIGDLVRRSVPQWIGFDP